MKTSGISANQSETTGLSDPVVDAINKLRNTLNRGKSLIRHHQLQNETQESSISFSGSRSTSIIDSSCADMPESNNIVYTIFMVINIFNIFTFDFYKNILFTRSKSSG